MQSRPRDEALERVRRVRREFPTVEDKVEFTQELIALRVSQLLASGQYVNLGMGIPTKVSNSIDSDSGVMLHAENGFLGYGPESAEDDYKWYYFNEGQQVTALAGCSIL